MLFVDNSNGANMNIGQIHQIACLGRAAKSLDECPFEALPRLDFDGVVRYAFPYRVWRDSFEGSDAWRGGSWEAAGVDGLARHNG